MGHQYIVENDKKSHCIHLKYQYVCSRSISNCGSIAAEALQQLLSVTQRCCRTSWLLRWRHWVCNLISCTSQQVVDTAHIARQSVQVVRNLFRRLLHVLETFRGIHVHRNWRYRITTYGDTWRNSCAGVAHTHQ